MYAQIYNIISMFPQSSQNLQQTNYWHKKTMSRSLLYLPIDQCNVCHGSLIGNGKHSTTFQHFKDAHKVIKIIDMVQIANDPFIKFVENFATRQMKQVNHVNVEKIYQVFCQGTNLYIISERGQQTIYKRLMKVKKMSQQQAVNIFWQIVAGYEYLVRKGLSLVKLLSKNIFLNENNTVKLASLSCSQISDHLPVLSIFKPQQIDRWRKSECQVWLLGRILSELIIGERLYQSSQQSLRILSELDITSSTKLLLERMLCQNPKDRIQMTELFQVCRKYQNTNLQQSMQILQHINNPRIQESVVSGEQQQDLRGSIVRQDNPENIEQQKIEMKFSVIHQLDQQYSDSESGDEDEYVYDMHESKHLQIIQGSPEQIKAKIRRGVTCNITNIIRPTSEVIYFRLKRYFKRVFTLTTEMDILFQQVQTQEQKIKQEKARQMLSRHVRTIIPKVLYF